MKIGVPKEIKRHEYRVGMTPGCARTYIEQGHSVAVESVAGMGAGFADDDYRSVGAEVLAEVKQLYGRSEMIIRRRARRSSVWKTGLPAGFSSASIPAVITASLRGIPSFSSAFIEKSVSF